MTTWHDEVIIIHLYAIDVNETKQNYIWNVKKHKYYVQSLQFYGNMVMVMISNANTAYACIIRTCI